MLPIILAILIALLIIRCIDESGLSAVGKILLWLIVIILLGGLTIGFPETGHYFSIR